MPSVARAAPVTPQPVPVVGLRAPDSMLLVGRASQPDALFSFIPDWNSHSKSAWSDLVNEVLPGSQAIVDGSAPFDFGVLVRRAGEEIQDPKAVISFGLRSLSDGVGYARRQPGAEQIGSTWYFKAHSGDANWCAVAEAKGPNPARAICGEGRDDVVLALDYMTQTLPLEAHGTASGIELEVRGEPARQLLRPELPKLLPLVKSVFVGLAIPDAPFNAALEQIASGIVDETSAVVSDLALVKASVTVDSHAVVARVSAKAEHANSWTTRFLRDDAERSCVAPESFWMLPDDAEQAAYLCELNPIQFDHARRTAGAAVQAVLDSKHATREARTCIRRTTADALALPASYVLARGAVPEKQGAKLSNAALQARQDLGWTILGVDQAFEIYTAYLARFLGLLNNQEVLNLVGLDSQQVRRDLPPAQPAPLPDLEPAGGGVLHAFNRAGANLRDRLVNVAAHIEIGLPPPEPAAGPPAATHRAAPGALRTMVQRKPLGDLPKGSVAFELEIPDSWLEAVPPKHGGYGPLKAVVVVVPDDTPDGRRTWIGASSDEGVLTQRLASMLRSERSLRNRTDLLPLRDVTSVAGGFVDLGAMLGGAAASRPVPAMPLFADVSVLRSDEGATFEFTYRVDLGTVGAMLAVGAGRH